MTLDIRGRRQNARPIANRRQRGAQGSTRNLAGKSARAIRRPGVATAATNVRLHEASVSTCRKPGLALPSTGLQVSLGATRVGPLLSRLEMHLGTARFLAELRQDALWEAGCEDAALALARLASGMTPAALDAALRSRIATGQRERMPRVLANFAPLSTGVPATRSASRHRRRQQPRAAWRATPRRPAHHCAGRRDIARERSPHEIPQGRLPRHVLQGRSPRP